MKVKDKLTFFHNNLSQEDVYTCDIGNSHPHVATWKKGIMESVSPLSPKHLKDLPKEKTIICSVSKEIQSSSPFSQFKDGQFYGMPIHYSQTLGHDRLALASYLFEVFKSSSLIIDAGTFTTVDFIDEKGFQGGHIIPGIKTLSESYKSGQQLFETFDLNKEKREDREWPQTTEEAITLGHQYLVQSLIEKISLQVETLRKDHPNLLVFCTGGFGQLFAEGLRNSLVDPHLLHKALYFQYVRSLS